MGPVRQKKLLFSKEQLALLEVAYKKRPIIYDGEAKRLSIKLGCEEKEVKIWFHNKLFKETNQPSAEVGEGEIMETESDSDDTTQSGSSPENISTSNAFFNKQETEYLLKIYLRCRKPIKSHAEEIAEYLNTTPQKINNWFTATRDQEAVIELDDQQEQTLMAAYRENDGQLSVEKIRQLAERLGLTMDRVKSWIRKTRSAEISSKVVTLNASHDAILEELYTKTKRPRYRDLKEISDKTNVNMISLENWFRSKRLQCNGTMITPQQQRALVEAYQKNKYLDRKEMMDLADRENLSQTQAENWFRRQRIKDIDFNELLTSSYTMNPAALRTLNEAYSRDKYISKKEIYQIADRIGVNKNQVRAWFDHRRYRDKDFEEKKLLNNCALKKDSVNLFAETYVKNKSPELAEILTLADLTGETAARVQDWFECQRRKDKLGLSAKNHEMLAAAYEQDSHLTRRRRNTLAHNIGIHISRVTKYFAHRNMEDKDYRKSSPFTTVQRILLLAAFEKDQYPSAEKRAALADKIGASEKRVQVWFWRTRAKAIKSKSSNIVELKTEKPNQKLKREKPDVKLQDMEAIKNEPKEDVKHDFDSEMKI